MPFAVVGANAMVDVRGKKIRGRQFPWGIVEVENPAHCDFVKLRTMLITHMQDLQEVTHDVHYENYRSQRLAKTATTGLASAAAPASGPVKRPPPFDDKDKQLQEKEAELRRMQVMVAAMQQQIKQQSQTSLASVATTGTN
jgi:septin 2